MIDFKNFSKPTPLKWKRFGYGLLTVSTVLSGYLANFVDMPLKNYVIGLIIVSGVLGKLLTDLTSEKEK